MSVTEFKIIVTIVTRCVLEVVTIVTIVTERILSKCISYSVHMKSNQIPCQLLESLFHSFYSELLARRGKIFFIFTNNLALSWGTVNGMSSNINVSIFLIHW